jgi:hypothetical protein
VAERLEFDLTRDLGYRFPDFVGSHPGQTAQTPSPPSASVSSAPATPTPPGGPPPGSGWTRSSP